MNRPEDQARYINCYKSFDKELVKHLPEKLPNNVLSHGLSLPDYLDESYHNYAGIHLLEKIYKKSEYQEIKREYIKVASFIGTTSDTCYLIIKTFYESKIKDRNHSDCDEVIPIPQYVLFESENHLEIIGKKQDRDILVLDFSPKDCLNRANPQPKERMPEKWENGYSKGLTFNDKEQTIEYWLIIW
jgi:hypothetical protein